MSWQCTLSELIERYIKEMVPPLKALGKSHTYVLRALQRFPIGSKVAATLTKQDWKDHAMMRRASVLPQSINQEITYAAGVLKYAGSEWPDCEDVSAASIEAAKPSLAKHNLIGKSTPRKRRPTSEEIEKLLAHFAASNALGWTDVDMVRVVLWQLASSRRISESCSLRWEDWNREEHTILVRRMKDPRGPKSKVVALPDEAQALLVKWHETRDVNEPRILPYRSQTCSARYTRAKAELKITNLRLHDCRRDCISRLIELYGFSPEEVMQVSGHETTAILVRNYLSQDPANFRHGPKALRIEKSAV